MDGKIKSLAVNFVNSDNESIPVIYVMVLAKLPLAIIHKTIKSCNSFFTIICKIKSMTYPIHNDFVLVVIYPVV